MLHNITGSHFYHPKGKTEMVTQRIYDKSLVLTFAKTSGNFGGLSNMAKDFPLFVNEILINNVESLYQACKFSLNPEIQHLILSQKNPMMAKRISRANPLFVRPDWDKIKYDVMEWCLMVKLLQNWERFSTLLKETNSMIIVEYSTKDQIWGAVPYGENQLIGINAMGRLLMKIRNNFVHGNIKPKEVMPPDITGFMLYGNPITKVYSPEYYIEP